MIKQKRKKKPGKSLEAKTKDTHDFEKKGSEAKKTYSKESDGANERANRILQKVRMCPGQRSKIKRKVRKMRRESNSN